MLGNIILIILVLLMSVGVFYQIKDREKNVEIKKLELSNAKKQNELIEMQIEDQRIRTNYLKKELSEIEKEK